MSILKNNKVIAVGDVNTYRPPILSCMWSDHLINDIQWLRADTFSWQSGDVYTTVYNKLVEEYSTGAEETEGSITFKRTSNGFKIATANQETVILNKYNTEGIAWYYILDTENRRFKLPRTKFGFKGLRTNAGDDIAESLPNIKGSFNVVGSLSDSDWSINTKAHTGAFYPIRVKSGLQTYAQALSNTVDNTNKVGLDASRSSSTYQDNAPVQERATQMYLYFYVGEFAQTAIEQTAGLNSEMFNGKAGTSLDNIDSSGQNVIKELTKSVLNSVYPVGSIYLSVNSTCPLAGLFGTWERVAEGKALWTGNGSNGGTTISAGLPDIYGAANSSRNSFVGTWNVGAFSRTVHNSQNWSIGGEGTWQGNYGDGIIFYASSSNSIYGNSSTVQPPSYVINAFRRTA